MLYYKEYKTGSAFIVKRRVQECSYLTGAFECYVSERNVSPLILRLLKTFCRPAH